MQQTWATILLYLYLAGNLLLASWLLQPFILLVIYSVSRALGLRHRGTPFHSVKRDYQFGIIITVHHETEFIPPIVDSLLKQSHHRFNVYVVADGCDTRCLHFRDPRIHILKPPSPLDDQIASLDYGLRHLDSKDEVLVIFDPDNLAHPEYLRTLNAWYNTGCRAVYGRMCSKNRETTYAQIDSCGAALTNFLDRDSRSLLGLSVSISGSGISVHRDVYNNVHYDQRSTTGGFDKQLQMSIARDGNLIVYAQEAVFYDEKVSDGKNFESQRIRWIGAYFKFLGQAFHLLLTGLRKGDFNLIYFSYNLIRPPYFILLLLSCCCMVIDWFINPMLSFIWLGCLAAFSLSFLLIAAKDITGSSPMRAILYIPRIFYRQLRSLLRLNDNRKSLLKTRHSQVLYIDDILKR